jgi:hypothetical protein
MKDSKKTPKPIVVFNSNVHTNGNDQVWIVQHEYIPGTDEIMLGLTFGEEQMTMLSDEAGNPAEFSPVYKGTKGQEAEYTFLGNIKRITMAEAENHHTIIKTGRLETSKYYGIF